MEAVSTLNIFGSNPMLFYAIYTSKSLLVLDTMSPTWSFNSSSKIIIGSFILILVPLRYVYGLLRKYLLYYRLVSSNL